jgi:hypothetical protein
MSELTVKAGDTAPTQTVRLEGRAGPANLTGATVVMQLRDSSTPVPCTVVDPAAGTVRPERDGLPVPPGNMQSTATDVEFEVTYSTGEVQTFPEAGYLRLRVWSDLDNR